MQTTEEMIQGLEDEKVVPVVEELYRLAFAAVPYETITQSLAKDEELERLERRGVEEATQTLTAERSVTLGRAVLNAFTQDAGHAALLGQAIANVAQEEDDDLAVSMRGLLTLGILLNLTLFNATTTATVEKGTDGAIHWSIERHLVSPELFKESMKLGAALSSVAH